MTNREAFKKLKEIKNKYMNETVIKSLLYEANDCENLTQFLPFFDKEVKNEEKLQSMLKRVLDGEPIQYVIGKTQFLDWVFNVNKNVLIPRVETEELAANILKILEQSKLENLHVVDLCCGSGCLGICIKDRFKNFDVTCIDISKEALDVAKENAKKYNVDINFINDDFIKPLINTNKKVDILVCNPPYIEDESTIDEQVYKHEPHLALLAKPAWKFYEIIFQYYKTFMSDNFAMFFEIGENMEKDLTNIMNINMDNVTFIFRKDIYGKTRFLFVSGVIHGDKIKDS